MTVNLGSTLGQIADAVIGSFGDTVTISRRPTTPGGSHATQTVQCMVCPLNQYSNAPLRLEAIANANESETHFFVFPVGTDIAEATDDIIHQGLHYRVLMQDEQMLSGSQVVVFAVAARID